MIPIHCDIKTVNAVNAINRHSNIDVGRKTNNRCYSKLPNHEQRYTDHRQIPFSLTSKKYIEIKKE